ncbi:MAG: hypothetical protein H0X29_06885 [Parachlamydiaceae bacterium]|nr:hypothetical protein [Parachlamydiaceae bacterium]
MGNINPIVAHVATVTAPSASDPTTAAGLVSTHGGSEANSKTKIGSLADLKKKSPKVYNLMMMGIATNICREMEHHQDELKKLMREGQKQT